MPIWYKYMRLPFRVAPAWDIFQRKIDETFKELPNIFGIADDILVEGYDKDDTDAPSRDMFQRKTDEIFKDLPNMFGITDDILFVGYDKDGTDHSIMLCRVLQICKKL